MPSVAGRRLGRTLRMCHLDTIMEDKYELVSRRREGIPDRTLNNCLINESSILA